VEQDRKQREEAAELGTFSAAIRSIRLCALAQKQRPFKEWLGAYPPASEALPQVEDVALALEFLVELQQWQTTHSGEKLALTPGGEIAVPT
jgi:hypothetical protein